jgi:hypothetical protein
VEEDAQPRTTFPNLPDLPTIPMPPPRRSSEARRRDQSTSLQHDDDDDRTPTSSRASTPRPRLPPLPTSLTQARLILKTSGHVNLADYLDARESLRDAKADAVKAKHVLSGQQPLREDVDVEPKLDLASLVYPSASSMIRYTIKEKRYVTLGEVKEAWLEPLLRDFGFKRSRGG